MQFSNPSQTILKDLLRSSRRDLLPNQAQEVVGQVFIYKDTLARDSVPWKPYVEALAKLGLYLLTEVGEDGFRNIFQDKLILSRSERVSVCELYSIYDKDSRTLLPRHDLGMVSLESVP